jgi:hypothetical protein
MKVHRPDLNVLRARFRFIDDGKAKSPVSIPNIFTRYPTNIVLDKKNT